MPNLPIIAVDIGNSRIKFGWFESMPEKGLPEPTSTVELATDSLDTERLAKWFEQQAQPAVRWWVASVNRAGTAQLADWVATRQPRPEVNLLQHDKLPLAVAVERPETVGIDRLAGAVAANRLRAPDRGAIVVDLGTAITVDVISAEGVFLGGAILPGIGMSARALDQFTDLLPWVPMAELTDPPPVLGTSTVSAMRSGVYWGAVGAIGELIARLEHEAGSDPQVFLTGGAGPAVASLVADNTRLVPHLVLGGIVLAAVNQ